MHYPVPFRCVSLVVTIYSESLIVASVGRSAVRVSA